MVIGANSLNPLAVSRPAMIVSPCNPLHHRYTDAALLNPGVSSEWVTHHRIIAGIVVKLFTLG